MSRCSHCYQYGHNRRTCPSRKERLTSAAENGNEWAKAELNKKAKARQCSFCRSYDHDRRKCPSLENIHSILTVTLKKTREFVAAKCDEHGFGVGSLVSFDDHEWVEGEGYVEVKRLSLVEDISWDTVAPRNTRVLRVSVVGKDITKMLELPAELRDFTGNLDQYYKDRAPRIVPGGRGVVSLGHLTSSACLRRAKEIVKSSEWSENNAKYYINQWLLEIGEEGLEGYNG
jgi:hypothetical protein